MRIWLALVLLTALSGCVTTPVFKPALTQVKGEVRLAGRLPFPGPGGGHCAERDRWSSFGCGGNGI